MRACSGPMACVLGNDFNDWLGRWHCCCVFVLVVVDAMRLRSDMSWKPASGRWCQWSGRPGRRRRARQRPGATAWPWAPLAEASSYELVSKDRRRRAAFVGFSVIGVCTMAFPATSDSHCRPNWENIERRLQPASVLCCLSLWSVSPRLYRSIATPPTKREIFAKLDPSRESAKPTQISQKFLRPTSSPKFRKKIRETLAHGKLPHISSIIVLGT